MTDDKTTGELRRTRRMDLYSTPSQLEAWRAGAKAAGLPTPDWARRMLDDAAARELRAAARRTGE